MIIDNKEYKKLDDIVSDDDLIKISHKVWPKILLKIKSDIPIKNEVSLTPLCIAKEPIVAVSGYGCSHHLNGGCTMCNYRIRVKDMSISDEAMKKVFDKAINYLHEKNNKEQEIYYYNFGTGGSFFDLSEISPNVRRYVYKKLLTVLPKNKKGFFSCESRLEYISKETLEEIFYYLGKNFNLQVGYGVESMNPIIRECCVHKKLPSDYIDKIKLLKEYKIFTKAHLIIKPPFLTEKEAIEDTLISIKKIIDSNMTDLIVVMAMSARKYTAVDRLLKNNKYQLPQIWSIIDIIKRLGPEIFEKQKISFNGFAWTSVQSNADQSLSLVRGCKECSPIIIPKLLKFKCPDSEQYHDLINTSEAINCSCKDEWEKEMNKNLILKPLKERIALGLDDLSKDILGVSIYD